jgi:hypothetical protein
MTGDLSQGDAIVRDLTAGRAGPIGPLAEQARSRGWWLRAAKLFKAGVTLVTPIGPIAFADITIGLTLRSIREVIARPRRPVLVQVLGVQRSSQEWVLQRTI